MRELVAAVAIGLVVSGCSAAGPAAPLEPPPPPPPTRPLVEWASVVCTQVKALEDAVKPSDSSPFFFVRSVVDGVDNATKALKKVKPSEVAAADGHVAGLVKALEAVRSQLPSATDNSLMTAPEADAQAKQKQVAELVSGLGPIRQQLVGVVENAPELLTSYNLTPACEPARAVELPGPAPTRDLVTWADKMCATVTSVTGLSTDPAGVAGEDPRFASFELESYLSTTRAVIGGGAARIAGLGPTGVAEADSFRETLLAALRDQAAKLPEDHSLSAPGPHAALQERVDLAKAAAAAVKPKAEGLLAAVGRGAALAASHDLAPSCVPRDVAAAPKRPLTARDGTDLAACRTGTCQVLITGTADVVVGDLAVRVSIRGGGMVLTTPSTRMSLGQDGTGKIGTAGGPTAVFTLAAVEGTTAVLDIGTE
ncbi:hypothetical protein SAMN05216188_12151 [Lentzea xinjiangensis]|uniref:DUF5667 domain-containing protein n=1 Tax=Lentzea xinjiangensis TaxID=402600 RepID=A0A1H9UDX1_9PSEU|nr:hypothetical protein [Lentzea xinjiangensis]SES07539.1 hypothetical protein SAMN05216188_12151 [Lentzea xinjiangensis]